MHHQGLDSGPNYILNKHASLTVTSFEVVGLGYTYTS